MCKCVEHLQKIETQRNRTFYDAMCLQVPKYYSINATLMGYAKLNRFAYYNRVIIHDCILSYVDLGHITCGL